MSIQLAVLASGRGSNLEAILKAVDCGQLDGKVSVVISNKPEAPALEIARRHRVPAFAIDSSGTSREDHELAVLAQLKNYRLDYLVLAGYMRVLSPAFLRYFESPKGYYRVINIHPSLLPAFPGQSAYEDAFAYGVKISGVTVHLVDEQVDHGPIVAQECFARLDDDTLETFKARGLAIEHKLYPSVLQEIARQGIRLLPGQCAMQRVSPL